MTNNCGTGGTVAGLTGQTPDCGDCRGISRITQSADKLSMTIYYTDGTSQVFSIPTLKGDTGATGATGTTGTGYVWNDETDSLNTTVGSFETVKSASTNHLVANENLVNVGDCLSIYVLFERNLPHDPASIILESAVQLLMGATPIIASPAISTGCVRIVFETNISLTDNTAGAMGVRVLSRAYFYQAATSTTYSLMTNGIREYNVQDLVGLNFATTDYTFYCNINSSAFVGAAQCRAFSGQITKIL